MFIEVVDRPLAPRASASCNANFPIARAFRGVPMSDDDATGYHYPPRTKRPRAKHPWRDRPVTEGETIPEPRNSKASLALSASELRAIRRLKRPSQSVSEYLRDQLPPSFWQKVEESAKQP